jgi:hypothetical protein
MDNHYHLLILTGEKHLSELMRQLNASYAQYYSKKYDRRGYLFQDRYKSLVTQDQGYVEQLIRYIHTNPLRAGICKTIGELNNYPWSGHAVLMGKRMAEFQDTWPVLRRFGTTVNIGRAGYVDFIKQAPSVDEKDDPIALAVQSIKNSTNPRQPASYVIGDREFVKKTIDSAIVNRTRIVRHRLESVTINDVAARVSKASGVPIQDLLRRSRGNFIADVRKVFSYICYREYGFSLVDVAVYLKIAHSAVSLAVRQGELLIREKIFAHILIEIRP